MDRSWEQIIGGILAAGAIGYLLETVSVTRKTAEASLAEIRDLKYKLLEKD